MDFHMHTYISINRKVCGHAFFFGGGLMTNRTWPQPCLLRKDCGHVRGAGADADWSSAGWPGAVCLETWDGRSGVPRGRELGYGRVCG